MAVAFVAAGSAVEAEFASTVTISVTVNSGEILIVEIEAGAASTPSITSVVYNTSENLSSVGTKNQNTFRNTFVYGIKNPSAGTHNVVVTADRTCNVLSAKGATYSGCDVSGTPWSGATGAGNDGSSSPSVSPSVASGSLAVVCGLSAADTYSTTNGTIDASEATTDVRHLFLSRAGAGGATQVNGTYGSSIPWAWVGFGLAPATALTAGVASVSSKTAASIVMTATDATGGTSPYTYQWKRKPVGGAYSDLTNGGGVSGATTLTVTDGSVAAGTAYVYKLTYTDSAGSPATVDSNEVTVRSLTSVTDTNVFFSPYNWYSDGSGTLQSNNVLPSSTYALTNCLGAYFKTKVTIQSGGAGNVSLKLDTSNLSTLTASKCPRVSVSVDSGAFTNTLVSNAGSTDSITLGSGLSAGTHLIEVFFYTYDFTLDANDVLWSTPKLALKVTGIDMDADAVTAAPTLYSRRIIVYGDSHTCGAGVVSSGTGPTANDATQAYGVLLGFHRQAEVGVVAFGGQGYTKGINNVAASSSNPSFYNATAAQNSWDKYFSGASRLDGGGLFSPAPDEIFILHGQNDASLTATPVTAVIDALRTAAGSGCWIFACSNAAGTNGNASAISTGVGAAASTAKSKYLAPTQLVNSGGPATRFQNDTSSHPNVRGQAFSAGEVGYLADVKIIAAGGSGTSGYSRGRLVNTGGM